ncbi:ANTAR domain-containing protein [Actinorhabdospora filicis]|uniref:ANTAR domain-containing protein n=1 Tax=Actinorhabdospora filicis TaxID=1785913 RepID=UPI002553DB10|nr:ANTAR domain-containing protein [Actinorhabdospora filicis]
MTDESLEALSQTVARLRKERDGLRRAMRSRSVIEQAKGILSERLGIAPEEAFKQLHELSTHSNVKLAELAAALVAGRSGVPDAITETAGAEVLDLLPPPSEPEAAHFEDLAEHLAEPIARGRLLTGRIEAARTLDEIAEAVAASTLGWPEPATVVVMMLEPDGALRLGGSSGLPADARSKWARVPPIDGLPMIEAIKARRPVLITDADALHVRFPTTVAPLSSQGLAAIPLVHDGAVIGVVELFWERPCRLDDETKAHLLSLAIPVAARAAVLDTGGTDQEGGADAPIGLVLDALTEPALLLAPVHDDTGVIVDFTVEAASAPARALSDEEDLSDGTLMTVLPRLGSQHLLPLLSTVAETGEPGELTGLYVDPVAEGTRAAYRFDVRAVRLWDRVLATVAVHDEATVLCAEFVRAEGRRGSFYWDLATGYSVWSPGMFRLAGRRADDGPMDPTAMAELVDPADLAGLLTRLGQEEIVAEVRGAGPLAGARLELNAVLGYEKGDLASVSGTIRDVTRRQNLTAQLKQARVAVAAERRRLSELLSASPDRLTVPGLVAEGVSADRALACWYDMAELHDGSLLLVVGEADPVGSAQRLRHAAVAYGMAGLAPSAVLTALNALARRLEPDATTSVTVAIAQPERLTWAAAGQGAPIRRAVTPTVHPGALGLPVGTVDGLEYTDNELILNPGERFHLCTAGALGEVLEALTADGDVPEKDLCLITATVLTRR